VRLVRLVEAVRTGFQQPSGPGAEVGTAQARHGGSMRGAGSGAGGRGAHEIGDTIRDQESLSIAERIPEYSIASCTPKRRADKINVSFFNLYTRCRPV
jgi:hypothetical protein